jgi:hypothetical protein
MKRPRVTLPRARGYGAWTMRAIWLAFALTSCGGLTVAPNDAASPATSPDADDAASPHKDGGMAGDMGAPEQSDGACTVLQAGCVFCSNEWHCPNAIYPPCPSGTAQGASCQGFGPVFCFSCVTGATSTLWTCLHESEQWSNSRSLPYSCSP